MSTTEEPPDIPSQHFRAWLGRHRGVWGAGVAVAGVGLVLAATVAAPFVVIPLGLAAAELYADTGPTAWNWYMKKATALTLADVRAAKMMQPREQRALDRIVNALDIFGAVFSAIDQRVRKVLHLPAREETEATPGLEGGSGTPDGTPVEVPGAGTLDGPTTGAEPGLDPGANVPVVDEGDVASPAEPVNDAPVEEVPVEDVPVEEVAEAFAPEAARAPELNRWQKGWLTRTERELGEYREAFTRIVRVYESHHHDGSTTDTAGHIIDLQATHAREIRDRSTLRHVAGVAWSLENDLAPRSRENRQARKALAFIQDSRNIDSAELYAVAHSALAMLPNKAELRRVTAPSITAATPEVTRATPATAGVEIAA